MPPKLAPNDLVAIVSPSNTMLPYKDRHELACRNFAAATGLRTVLAPNALAQHYYSAGTTQQRLDDFHWAIAHPDVKAIVFSGGGEVAIHLVPHLDYELIKRNPKIIAGISDVTTLLGPITALTGLTTFHGLELLDYATHPMTYETASIKKAWFDGHIGHIQPNPQWKQLIELPSSYTGWRTIREGQAEGHIAGGNYESFAQLVFTPYAQKLDNSILVIEHCRLRKAAIDKTLHQLRMWRILDKIAGLVMGYCLGSDRPESTGDDRSMVDLVLEATDGYDFPAMWVGEVGHNVENIMLPIGANMKMDASRLSLEVTDKVVSEPL